MAILTIDPSGPANILAYAGQLFNDTSILVWLAIGLPVGFFIINKIVGLFRADWEKGDELIRKVESKAKELREIKYKTK